MFTIGRSGCSMICGGGVLVFPVESISSRLADSLSSTILIVFDSWRQSYFTYPSFDDDDGDDSDL